MKKHFVVMNPVSGTIAVDTIDSLLRKHLKNTFTLYVTTGKESVPDKVRNAIKNGAKSVIAIGGDGTLSDCAEGVVDTKIPLVLVPTGTANNLAKELETPLDPELAIKVVTKKNKIMKIDAMKANNKYYFLDISIGAKSLAIRNTSRKAKLRFGIFAYALKATQSFLGFRQHTFFINADNKVATVSATELAVANAGIFGIKALKYSNNIHIYDGIINICIIKAQTLLDYVKIGYRFLLHHNVAQSNVIYMTAKKSISITTATKLPVQADGEIIGKGEVEITVIPQCVHVAVPLSGGY